jgi:hypothetical protein
MQFNQSSPGSSLYIASDRDTAIPTVLLLLPQNAPATPLSISFADSWTSDPGMYIFMQQPLAAGSEQTFVTTAWQQLAPTTQGFAWSSWNGSGQAFDDVLAASPASGTAAMTFLMQQVMLTIPAGTQLTQTGGAFQLTPPASSSISVQVDAGTNTLTIDTGGPLTIRFTGALSGCLMFPITFSEEAVNAFNTGLRLFLDNPQVPTVLFRLGYPVFNDTLSLFASLDPRAPLDPAQTFFAFNESDIDPESTSSAPAVASYYTGMYGGPFLLAPQSGSRLVFAVDAGTNPPISGDPFYLTPSGDFALHPASGGDDQLMGGLSAVESFAVSGDGTTLLSFFPGRNAYVTSLNTPTSGPPVATTSYAYIGQTGYYAQPDRSVLFQAPQPWTGAFAALAPMSLQARTLGAASAAASFPLFPYAGVQPNSQFPANQYEQIESRLLSPMRRNTIIGATSGKQVTVAAPSVTGMTPQGLLTTLSADLSQWATITVAQTGHDNPLSFTWSNVAAPVTLNGNTASLQSALQTNKLFLVISDATALGTYLQTSQNQIDVAGWIFNLARPDTIVIFKFYDQPIKTLVQQASVWTDAAVFNQDPRATAATISAIIAAAPGADSDYATFIDAVTDAQWNGILILNAGLPPSGVPPTLTGLLAGIDTTLLYGHHIGIELSNVNVANGALTMSNTSIFGLVHYTVPRLINNGAPYQFAVEELKVLFLNSAIADFISTIDLQIKQLFCEAAALQQTTDNILQLRGTYQSNSSGGTYSFTTTGVSVFNMTSAVLNAVQLTAGQFVTVGTANDVTTSQFVFRGVLDFQALANFDVFSFGRAARATAPAGLSIGNLAIVVTQQNATSSAAAPPHYAFDASQLTFDIVGSQTRQGSFVPNFPLTLSRIVQSPAGAATPQSFGYMSVQTPLNQSSLGYPWYALDFDLNLGGAGALASAAGFSAGFTVAWSPASASDYAVFTGLRLPESNGGSGSISIEGLFDITFKTLEIVIAANDPGAFILILYDIAFSFFSLTFPPSGQVDFALFGNPGAAGTSSLGWYAAYAKGAK